MNDEAINNLLERLDALARERPYPPAGLRIHGPDSQREVYAAIVAAWLQENSQESQR